MGVDGTQDPAVLEGMLDAASAARSAEARGEDVRRFPLFPATEEEARRGGPHVHEGWEYYRTPRAEHPRSAKTLTWTSVDRLATFDAFAPVGLIAPRPLLLIAGREAVTSWMSMEAFQRASGTKELAWIEGASHIDLYDKDAYVLPAVERLAGFFTTHLAA
ncbi:alpha/beta hydrolase [Streptomyces niveus]|uniref:alpha/beta hydrolase n=1 Tax=Streptomyces niveus TaxID=193462 RepID=UPI0033DA2127